MTGGTSNVGMAAFERKTSIAIVVELLRLPTRRDVTLFAQIFSRFLPRSELSLMGALMAFRAIASRIRKNQRSGALNRSLLVTLPARNGLVIVG